MQSMLERKKETRGIITDIKHVKNLKQKTKPGVYR